MEPGVDEMAILTDPAVIATSREPWMREMVEISHEAELAPGVVLYVYRELPYVPPGWEGTSFDQEPGEDDEEQRAQALSELLNGRTGVSVEMAIRLSKAFGSTPETWLGMQMAYDLWQARNRAKKIAVERFATA